MRNAHGASTGNVRLMHLGCLLADSKCTNLQPQRPHSLSPPDMPTSWPPGILTGLMPPLMFGPRSMSELPLYVACCSLGVTSQSGQGRRDTGEANILELAFEGFPFGIIVVVLHASKEVIERLGQQYAIGYRASACSGLKLTLDLACIGVSLLIAYLRQREVVACSEAPSRRLSS